MLMPPLVEYLFVEVKIDEQDWVKTKWGMGDTADFLLRADGVMTVEVIVLTGSTGGANLYLGDNYNEQCYEVIPARKLTLRVSRSFDSKVADIAAFPISVSGTRIEMSNKIIEEQANDTAKFSKNSL